MQRTVYVWRLGRMAYRPALELQKILTDQYKASLDANTSSEDSPKDTLLLVEHDPVYTIGIRTKGYDEKEEARLRALGADFCRTNRGGLITFHGPGQLVAYPIMNLKHLDKPGVRCYVSNIEDTIINMCRGFNMKAVKSEHTGVWVRDHKICAIGIHASRHITSHGLALNCNTDLKWFEHIVPCGIEGKGVTSLTHELGMELSVNQTIPYFLRSFGATFKCNLESFPRAEEQKLLQKISCVK